MTVNNKMFRALSGAVMLCLLPGVLFAMDWGGDSKTYLRMRETNDNRNLLTGYEYLDVSLENIGTEGVSFHSAGWLRQEFLDTTNDERGGKDLQYAYLSFRKNTDNMLVRAGRMFINDGIITEQIDGVYYRTDLKGGFGFSAFAGSPVYADADGRSGDSAWGGRIFNQKPGLYTLGVSYLKEKNSTDNYREETGLDLWFSPVKTVQVMGRSSYNIETSGWMEHAYTLSLGPFEGFRINAEASYINYEHYFHASTLSAFFAPSLNLEDDMTSAGGNVEYSVTKTFSITADYKRYMYDIAGSADHYGGKLGYYEPQKGSAGLMAHRMNGDTARLRYNEYRAYGQKKIYRGDITADIVLTTYDLAVNGVENSYQAVLAAGYDITEKARVAADVEYAHTPDYHNDTRGFLKFIYRFGSTGKGK